MKEIWKEYILPDRVDRQWYSRLFMSFVLPAVLFFLRPVGMDLRESAVTAGVVLAIIWWSSGIVKKIPAAVLLLLLFMLVSQTGYQTVFSFPLSETFPMLVITYPVSYTHLTLPTIRLV